MREIDLTVGHPLSFAVMFVDYFLGHAIAEELAVSVDGPVAPIHAQGGAGRRQADGTYRFIDLAPGTYTVMFDVPSRRYRALTPPLSVAVPLVDPGKCLVQPLWPTARSAPPSGMTAIRGRLIGANVADVQIEVAATPAVQPPPPNFSAFTRSDPDGEFLFLLPEPVTVDADPGLAPLTVQVAAGGRPVLETRVLGGTPAVFASASFQIPAARPARVLFQV